MTGYRGMGAPPVAPPARKRRRRPPPVPPNTSAFPTTYDPSLSPQAPDAGLAAVMRVLGRQPSYSVPPLPPAFFTPTSPAAMRSQAAAFVTAQTDPVIQEIVRAINARAAAGSASIAQGTKAYADEVAAFGPQIGAAYDKAQADAGKANAGLAELVGAQGSKDFQEIAGKLADAGAPSAAVDNSQAKVEGLGQGSAASTAAYGSADLQNLIAAGASDRAYAAKLPIFAQMTGLGALRDFQGQAQQDLADQVGQVRASVPGLTQSIYQQLQDRDQAKAGNWLNYQGMRLNGVQLGEAAAQGRAGLVGDYITKGQNLELQKALARVAIAEDAAKYGMDEAHFQASLSADQRKEYDAVAAQQAAAAIDRYNAITGRKNANTSATQTQAQIDLARQAAATQISQAKDQKAIDWYNAHTARQNAATASRQTTANDPALAALNDASARADTLVPSWTRKVESQYYGEPARMVPPSYQEAVKRLRARFGAQLRKVGVPSFMITQWINDTLAANGIYGPQAHGRARAAAASDPGGPYPPTPLYRDPSKSWWQVPVPDFNP